MGGCCGKATPVVDPSVRGPEPKAQSTERSEEIVVNNFPDLAEVEVADFERKEQELLAAQRERDKKGRQRKEEAEQRAALAKKLAEQKHSEEMTLTDALEREMQQGAASLSDESESEEEEEEEEDLPEFQMGKRVKLRDPKRGKVRRTKINLNSGYDVKKVAKLVEKDLDWQEPEDSDGGEEEHKPPLTFSVKLSMDFDDIDDDNRAEFEEEVLADIAGAADVPKELLMVSGLRQGSVIVDIEIERDADALGEERTADVVVLQLMAQIKDTDSKLYKGKHTYRAVSVTSSEPLEDPTKAKKKPAPQKVPLWRTVVLYICSSLEQDVHRRGDLEDERKVLYHDVLPQLKSKYAQRMIHLLTVDPRLSYSGEPMSSHEAADVIKTTSWSMNEGRPPIVLALRGSKHGWVPNSRQEMPEGFESYWRKNASLQQLEMDVALQKATCAIVYYRSKPQREESDEEDTHSSSDERDVLPATPLPKCPHTIAALAGEGGDRAFGSPLLEAASQRPQAIAALVAADGERGYNIADDTERAAVPAYRPITPEFDSTVPPQPITSLETLSEGEEDDQVGGGEENVSTSTQVSQVVAGGNFGSSMESRYSAEGLGGVSFMLMGRHFGSVDGDVEGRVGSEGGEVAGNSQGGEVDSVDAGIGEGPDGAGDVLELDAEPERRQHAAAEAKRQREEMTEKRKDASMRQPSMKMQLAEQQQRVDMELVAALQNEASRSKSSAAAAKPPTAGLSRRSDNSRTGGARSSSVGSVQARHELEEIGNDVGDLVSGVVSHVVDDFPNSGV